LLTQPGLVLIVSYYILWYPRYKRISTSLLKASCYSLTLVLYLVCLVAIVWQQH